MSNEQTGGASADDSFLAELYLRLEERAGAQYSDDYDVADAAARYRVWLSSKTVNVAQELVDLSARIDTDGRTVYVRTADGERVIGSWAAGSPKQALTFFQRKFQSLEIEGLLADAVRIAAEAGDLRTAQALAGHADALAADSEIPHRQANALYCRGLLDHDASRLLTAAERYKDAGRLLLRAKALEAAAREFVEAGDRGQARAVFTLAVEAYTSLGAARDVARLQAEFRAHGIRRGPRAKYRRARSGWDSLTATEIKIATLVEEGMSNPEIAAKLLLSRRTIGTHVSHILKKLDVNSRTDIARESALRRIGSR
jgi:DNA-binding NarL/FixJ family response regulator